ncbi:MAG: GlsB/YeaQ/YmgE family stress response membrane protein [Candidatus Blackburnbacteria bacterium]|nr:GlsB/YeaQ/YmgE family stress response membrane protein [Candidatus Blackburnbacteria bacterium]
MGLLLWIIFGALVGWVASLVIGTNKSQGILMDVALGLLGALVGGLVMNFFLGTPGITGFNISSFIVSLLGAMALVWIGRRLLV